MDQLQIGLAIAGGAVLLGVLVHGAWTSRKNTPRKATPAPSRHTTPGATGTEPHFDDPTPANTAFALGDLDALNDLVPNPHLQQRPALDALIDIIATLKPEPPVSAFFGEAALGAMPSTWRIGSKPFSVEGHNISTAQWENPRAGQRYSSFQCGVQLANRSGALTEIEYSEFVDKTQAFADAVNADAGFPEMLEAVARARELDQFASSHDAQLGFNVRARHSAWSPSYVQQHAARLGFVAGMTPGRMVLPASLRGLPAVLVLEFDAQAALADDPTQSALRGISLHLDVAHVDRSEQPFERMRDAAYALAEAMDGQVTDDNGQALAPQAMELIATDLQYLYDTLDQRDLSAGSPQARRLFS